VGLFSSLNPSRKDMSCQNLGCELPGKWCPHEPWIGTPNSNGISSYYIIWSSFSQ
jgi:hypothetical protein